MAGLLSRRLLALLAAALALVSLPAPGPACPFCGMQGQTLTTDVTQASMVLVGTFTNAKRGANVGEGSTDLVVDAVIKKNDILDTKAHDVGGKKVVTLDRYVPGDDKKYKFLVLCDVFKGTIDPYRGVQIRADCDIAGYLDGALKVKDKKPAERLAYFFKYLDNAEVEVSNDAYKEFANADYKDYRDMAHDLPPDTIAKWLRDPNTPPFRYGLYASMLGHCGKDEHAKLLRSMLDDPQKKLVSGADGILAGYTMLKPKEGWQYLRGVLKDSSKDFTQRYAALRAVRFFWDMRPDLIDKKALVEGVAQLLDQSDIADLAIEDLRKWGRWELADRVLGLYDQKSHDVPIIRRAILRYALSCKAANGGPHEKAQAFVDGLRKKDPQMVTDAEELLRLETNTPAPAASGTGGK
jgi:hypothetical protein